MKQRPRSILGRIAPRLAPLLAPAIVAAAAQGQPTSDPAAPDSAAKVRLISEHKSVAPGAETWLGVEFDIAPGWHIYWPGQNDSGYAPTVAWTLPEGFTVGELQWPTPHRHILPGNILDHIYEGRVVLLAKLTSPATLTPNQPIPIAAHVEWLECEEGCVQQEADVTLTLAATASAPAAAPESLTIGAAQGLLPRPGRDHVKVKWDGPDRVTLTPSARPSTFDASRGARPVESDPARVAFYPHESGAPVIDPLKTAQADGSSITLALKPGANLPLRGILQCWDAAGASLGAWAIDSTPEQAIKTDPADAESPTAQ